MNLNDAPTMVLRTIVSPRAPRRTRMQKVAIGAVMLMLFELGFALGNHHARHRPKHPALPQTVAARPQAIHIPPIVVTRPSVIGSEGAGLRSDRLEEDPTVR